MVNHEGKANRRFQGTAQVRISEPNVARGLLMRRRLGILGAWTIKPSRRDKMISEKTSANASANLEYPACALCRSERRELRFRLQEPYNVVRCTACGFHYLYPRLAENSIREAYQQLSYYEGGTCGYADASYTDQERALRATFKCLLNNLARRGMTGGDVLEVGCGYGYFLDEARPYFDRRVGTDFSEEAAMTARRTGAEVFVGGIEQVSYDRKFDCVVAIQVIEHVYEPLLFVQHLARHTKSGGHVLVATPDIGGVLRKSMGRRWPSFKVPEHVLYFDFRTLRSLMRRAGLRDVQRLPYPHAFPLGLIAAKFRSGIPGLVAGVNVWVPATTVAVYARLSNE
jgi:2-polyprenyl-3-methyl-5-hydroxy-6-metoxy-1,4-benzoquinol methylase